MCWIAIFRLNLGYPGSLAEGTSQMAIALFRSKFEGMKADAGILDEVLESFRLSLAAAFRMVTRLGLETHEAVERQVQNGEGHIYLAIARLLEAYGSRFAPSGTVRLNFFFRSFRFSVWT